MSLCLRLLLLFCPDAFPSSLLLSFFRVLLFFFLQARMMATEISSSLSALFSRMTKLPTRSRYVCVYVIYAAWKEKRGKNERESEERMGRKIFCNTGRATFSPLLFLFLVRCLLLVSIYFAVVPRWNFESRQEEKVDQLPFRASSAGHE